MYLNQNTPGPGVKMSYSAPKCAVLSDVLVYTYFTSFFKNCAKDKISVVSLLEFL